MERVGEPRIWVHAALERPDLLELDVGSIGAFSAPCPLPGRRNEDCAAVIPLGERRVLLVVADGMGGCPGGEVAAQIATEEIAREAVAGTRGGRSVREAVFAGFEAANRAILERMPGSGTTAVAAAVEESRVRIFHLGDSRALLVGGRGRTKHETVDHSPVGYAVASGTLTVEEAMRHYARHLVSRFLGSPEMTPDESPSLPMRPRDTLLLATDGLFDNLYPEEVASLLLGGTAGESAARLVTAAHDRMRLGPVPLVPSKPDDLTLLVFRPRIRR